MSGHPDDFDDVLAAAQAGAEWAIALLYRRHQLRVLRYLRARLGDSADDVASQVWIEVARGLRGFAGGEEDFRKWLFTIARRRLADEWRGRSRSRGVATAPEQMPTVAVPGPDDEVGGDEAARRIVSLLPPELAEIVLLRVVAGLSVDEVAEITGRRAGTVRVLQHRALKRLRRQLEESGDDV